MALPDGAPLKSAHKADWVEYAIDHGVASFEAWDANLPDLIARFEVPDVVPVVLNVDPQDIGPGHSGATPEPEPQPAPSEPRSEDIGPGHAVEVPKAPTKPAKRPLKES